MRYDIHPNERAFSSKEQDHLLYPCNSPGKTKTAPASEIHLMTAVFKGFITFSIVSFTIF